MFEFFYQTILRIYTFEGFTVNKRIEPISLYIAYAYLFKTTSMHIDKGHLIQEFDTPGLILDSPYLKPFILFPISPPPKKKMLMAVRLGVNRTNIYSSLLFEFNLCQYKNKSTLRCKAIRFFADFLNVITVKQ